MSGQCRWGLAQWVFHQPCKTYSSYTFLLAVGYSTVLYQVLLNEPRFSGISKDQACRSVVVLGLMKGFETEKASLNKGCRTNTSIGMNEMMLGDFIFVALCENDSCAISEEIIYEMDCWCRLVEAEGPRHQKKWGALSFDDTTRSRTSKWEKTEISCSNVAFCAACQAWSSCMSQLPWQVPCLGVDTSPHITGEWETR